MNIEVNYLAVLLSGVAYMVVGFLWYSPMFLGKPWMDLMGYSEKKLKDLQKKMGPLYGLSFVASLVTAFMLSHVATMSSNSFGYTYQQSALTSAFFMWLGFVAPVQLTDVIFGNRPWKLFAINTGYQLVALLSMAVVIGMVGL